VNPIDALELSWKQGFALVAGLRPSDFDIPTPCAGWDVRGLLNHTLGEAQMMTEVNQGLTGGNDRGDLVRDGSGFAEAWEHAAGENVASWRAAGLEGTRTYFYGTFPAGASAAINVGEILVHSWDLARATGQDFALDPEAAAVVYGLYSAFPLDGMRAAGQLGQEVPTPADAPIADRLLGLLGRRP
jgi:uncharacterized protein (TIGR03086 family)